MVTALQPAPAARVWPLLLPTWQSSKTTSRQQNRSLLFHLFPHLSRFEWLAQPLICKNLKQRLINHTVFLALTFSMFRYITHFCQTLFSTIFHFPPRPNPITEDRSIKHGCSSSGLSCWKSKTSDHFACFCHLQHCKSCWRKDNVQFLS